MNGINILAIGAHPDDIEFGCGGSLIKFAEKGNNVYLLVMTEGSMGGEKSVRRTEQIDSLAILGGQKLFWGGYKDTHLHPDQDLINQIENVIREVEPVFIFVHFPDDTHQDHRYLAQATISATRYVRNVLFYEGPTTQNFNPQVFVNINVSLESKIEALKAHRSQIQKTNIENLSIVELARSSANFRGIQGRVKYAEAFQALRLFVNV